MISFKNSDREALAARVNALRLAEQALRQNNAEAVPAIRRISRSLRIVSDGHSEIAQLAAALEQATDADVGSQLQKMLPRLRGLAANLHSWSATLLIVEDDEVTAQLLEQRLRAPNRHIVRAGSVADAEHALQEHEISLVLLDLHLPDGDGRDLLLRLRQRSATAAVPILVLSAKDGTEPETECYALGADMFFRKPFDPVMIATAVAARLQRAAEVTRRSTQDPLTGLPNRAAFTHAFARAAMLASRSKEPLTVAILDVDRFKSVNDIFGHAMGDKVLRRLATVVTRSLRASDLLARWGGEEFAVFFPHTDLDKARLALNKALAAFRAEKFSTRDGRSFQVTFSAGVAQVKDGATVEQAIAEADRFLYLAKASGRDHVLTEADKLTTNKKHILLVEDDDLTASVIKHYLLRDGFKVVHARAAPEALDAAGNPSISLITLDVKIPGMDGFELLQRFREVPSLQQVPIVMLTSSGKQEDIVRGFQLGADDYILKPFAPRELLARVHRFLQKQ